MKKLLLFLGAVAIAGTTNAQISAYINGKEVKTGATVSQKDLASLQVGFKKPKNVTVISGLCYFYVSLQDSKQSVIESWSVKKDGYVAINDFLKSTPSTKKFKVFGGDEFAQYGNNLEWVLKDALGQESRKTIQVKVGLYVVEETGYKKYGQPVQLLEPVVLNVPVWETSKLYLPYLDLTLDKTNISRDFDLKQNGRLEDKYTILGYDVKDDKDRFYSVYALSSDQFPGLTRDIAANDFIRKALISSNVGWSNQFKKDYDFEKYPIDWDAVNGIDLTEDRFRLHSLSSRVTKGLKKMDLMTLFEPVEVNGMKGLVFRDDVDFHISSEAPWKPGGVFAVYFLTHPTNPKLTLVVSSRLYGNEVTDDAELDRFLKVLIKAIKK